MGLWGLGSNDSRLGNIPDLPCLLSFQQEREMGMELPGRRIARLVRFRYFRLYKLQGIFQCRLQHGSTHLGDITSGVHAEILRLECTNTKSTPADYWRFPPCVLVFSKRAVRQKCAYTACSVLADSWDSATFSSIFLHSNRILFPSQVHARPTATTHRVLREHKPLGGFLDHRFCSKQ